MVKREGSVTVGNKEVAAIEDVSVNVPDDLGEDWWTDERTLRLGRHERDKDKNLITIETHCVVRGVCRDSREREALNKEATAVLKDLFLELSLTYYEDLA